MTVALLTTLIKYLGYNGLYNDATESDDESADAKGHRGSRRSGKMNLTKAQIAFLIQKLNNGLLDGLSVKDEAINRDHLVAFKLLSSLSNQSRRLNNHRDNKPPLRLLKRMEHNAKRLGNMDKRNDKLFAALK